MRRILLVYILIFHFFIIALSYSWPMKDSNEQFTNQLSVSGTLGDLRGTTSLYRFHRGIDIAQTGNVYPIFSGIAHYDGTEELGTDPHVRIDNFWYIHIVNRISELEYVDGIENIEPTLVSPIGRVMNNHLHFQIGEFNTDGPFYNPLFYADSLDNYSDDNLPIFDSIIYYKAFTTINGLEASIETTDVRVKPDSVLFNNRHSPG